jgi:hypothetical protein
MKSTSNWVLALVIAAVLSLPARADLKPTTLPKPLPVKATLTGTLENVEGALTRYDATILLIKTAKGDRELKWSALTRLSQFVVRKQIVDPNSADEWIELAQLAAKLDMRKEAETAVANALRVDPASKAKGEAILGTSVHEGAAAAPATTQRAAATIALKNAATRPSAPAKGGKYQKASAEQNAQAIAYAEARAKIVADGMGIKLTTLKTAHFIIFTNWDSREHTFLKNNCENAYTAVSRQFDIPISENVFVGLLPVFMFDTKDQFIKYANEFDKFAVPKTWLGYFSQHADGSGHMVMWKPETKKIGVEQAEVEWAHTLTHEFTHAFVSRYRSNQRIPRWLNEGLAEVIAGVPFPRPGTHAYARMMAGKKFDFQDLFDDKKLPPGEMYPVMQTMVEALIQEDRKAFLKMFDDIKDGMDPEAAMRKNYKAGYADWEKAWRNYAKKLPNE